MNACLDMGLLASQDTVPVSVLQLRSSAGLYGADRMVLALNHALVRPGVSSRLLTISNYRMESQPLHERAIEQAQAAALLRCRRRFDPRTTQALIAQVDETGAPLLHVHDYKSAFYAWLASRRRPLRVVATLHGWIDGTSAQRLYNRIELGLLRRFDALVVVSHGQVETLLRAGVPRTRIHQIDNGIVLPELAAPDLALARRLGLQEGDYVFGAVARLSAEKNLSLLLEAFAQVVQQKPRARLLIAGDGPERAALLARTRELGIDAQVNFLGVRDDMPRIYSLLDCMVLPSLSEGMPLVVLEAMACRLPVIASAVGDVPRLLATSDCGRLVAPGEAPALVDAMLAASDEPDRRDERARAHVLARHSSQAMADRYLDLYRALGDRHVRVAS